jgi:hypothetical protein
VGRALDKTMMVDHEAFLKGIKPALYRAYNRGLAELFPKLQEYPHLKDHTGRYLFFQTEEKKQEYVDRIQQIDLNSPEYHKMLGLLLGYPPKAVDFFVRKCTDRSLSEVSIGLGYAGIRCVCDVRELIENTKWLWDTYQLDEELRLFIGEEFVYVPYQDMNELIHVHASVLKQMAIPDPLE